MNFTILVLGSGAATPTFNRHCSAQMININGVRMLLDCGESTQNQLRKYHQKFQAINAIFITHLHGDHFFGLPGLLSTMHLCGRTTPLTVYAPVGAKESIELLFRVSGTEVQYELNIVELEIEEPTVIHRERSFHVTAFPMHHSITCYGYIFEEEPPLLNLRKDVVEKYKLTNADIVSLKQGNDYIDDNGNVLPNSIFTLPRRQPRRYAYCCDTSYDETLVDIVKGVDMLCMESTFDNSFADLAVERCHCTAAQAAKIAAKAEAKRLVLTHFSARYKSLESITDEARAIFPNTVCAEDGVMFDV